MSAHRFRFSSRWLAAGGAAVLAGILGVAMLLHDSGAACAAPPGTTQKTGKATFYDLAGTSGNCSLEVPADDLYVALGPSEYSEGASCGAYLDVTGPKGKVRVKVFDSCPECPAGHIDLSRTAFKKIGTEIDGIIPIKYKLVTNPSTPAPISVRIKEGASQYWFAARLDNHGNLLSKVQVAGGGGFKTAHRTDYNYWLIDAGAGPGPFKIKITDVYGNTATVTGIKMSPGTVQKTGTRMTGGSSTVTAAEKAVTPSAKATTSAPAKTAKSATPSASATTAAPLLEATTAPGTAAPATDQPLVDLAAAEPAATTC
ncbi:expansin EXLX1 family cellulose-binding protein [Actinoplanes xinjiangensis]|uniref:expansin EXLX1 family cellulose-binding protein n=1 Tax=Actinoplanes xinjiangensis TaxID=512350 RepID=UPI0034424FE3